MKLDFRNDGFSLIQGDWASGWGYYIGKDLRLKSFVSFYLEGCRTHLGDDGHPRYDRDSTLKFGHDGDACWIDKNIGTVRVAIEKKNAFRPFAYETNPACGDGYINDIVEIRDHYELFVFLAAHELRHFWQWENPRDAKTMRR